MASRRNRDCSCVSCSKTLTIKADMEDNIYPPIAPKAGVRGHAW